MGKGRFAAMTEDLYRQRKAYILALIGAFGGMIFGWVSGVIGGVLTLASFQKSFALDKNSKDFGDLQGNIVSILQAGCIAGAMSSFFFSQRFGRKWAILMADVVFLVGTVMQTCAGLNTTSLGLLYAGRFIAGMGKGLITAVVPAYISESAPKQIRGRCVGLIQLYHSTGMTLGFFVNYGLSRRDYLGAMQWRIPFALQMVPGVCLFVGLLFQNESPRWLVERGDTLKARRALSRVRALSEEDPTLVQELDEIIADFEKNPRRSFPEQFRSLPTSKATLYPFCMAIILNACQQSTGTNSMNYYSPQVFENVGISSVSSVLLLTGIYGVVKLVCTAVSLVFLTEQLGRKWSLIISGSGMAFSMFYIGIQGAVVGTSTKLTGSSYFAIVCVMLYSAFFAFGWGPVPWVLCSECAPNHLRSLIMASALMTQWLFNFLVAFISPILLEKITYGTFLVYGGGCLLGVVIIVFGVPESKKIPLEKVHVLFEGNIIKGALRDIVPSRARAKALAAGSAPQGKDGGSARTMSEANAGGEKGRPEAEGKEARKRVDGGGGDNV
ncbi:MAG: hypothetical protein LQ351_005500 [Letrouitia transgressa]|nr:MAG: hypothetical protein LQ351_005500 [Letrouitia transgressa]